MFRANYQEDRIVLERLRDGFNGDIITEPRQSMRRNSCAIKFSLCERLEASVYYPFLNLHTGLFVQAMLVGNCENMGTK